MDAINYSAINLTGVNKLESNIKKDNANELEDGLDQKELKQIDQNKDGVITEEEFKKKYGAQDDSYKAVWNAYSQAFCKSSAKTEKNGNTTVTQNVNGNEIISTYNKAGELVGYTTKVKSTDGKTTQTDYSIDTKTGQHKLGTTTVFAKNGKKESEMVTNDNGSTTKKIYKADGKTLDKTEVKNPNNTTCITNAATGDVTKITKDGTEVTRTKDGKLKEVVNGKEKTTFAYDANGNVKSVCVEINGKKTTYKGDQITTNKKGQTVVKDGKKAVLKVSENSQGEESLTLYDTKTGKKSSVVRCTSDGYPGSIFTYNKDGKLKDRTYCQTGRFREYIRDSKGNVTESIDYKKKNGQKISKQTYFDQSKTGDIYANNDDALWATRTYYDKDGKETKYVEYDYKKNDDGTVKATTVEYTDSSKKTKSKTVEKQKDSYANTLLSDEYDAKNNFVKSTEVKYKDSLDEKKTKADVIEKIITEASGQKTVEKYDYTKLMSKDVEGQYKEEYTYHSSGVLATKKNTPADNKSYTFSTYRENGKAETESYYENHGSQPNTMMNNKQFDENGELELNTDFTYQDLGYSWQKYDEIKTTDKNGNLVNHKKHDQFGNRKWEKDVYSNGCAKETEYAQIEGEITPNKIVETDADANTTNSQLSLRQFIMDKYGVPFYIAENICNLYIGPHNQDISCKSMLTEEDFGKLDLSHFKVEPNGLVLPA